MANCKKLLLLVLFFVLLNQSVFAEQTLITFDEIQGEDVVVDTQYSHLGIVFLASAAIGLATEIPNCRTIPTRLLGLYGLPNPPALRCRHPALFFDTDPDFGIITRFFDNDFIPRRATYARNVSFDLSIAIGSQATVTTFDANDQFKNSVTVRGAGIHRVTLPGIMHRMQISVPDSDSKFAIDNYSFELLKLKIEKPRENEQFPLNQNNFRETEIEYKTNIMERGVEFETKLEYQTTSGGRGQPDPNPLTESFSARDTSPVKRTYTAKGGKLTVNASFTEDGFTAVAKPVTAFIVGTMIPDADITLRLHSLYRRGATPGLLTGIAARESSYRQFSGFSKFGITALWPTESLEDGGSHIGLMQVETTYERAWDWHENTAFGARLFVREKLPATRRNERRIRRGVKKLDILGHSGLRPLTDVERENMALVLYGPFAPGGPNVPAPTLAEKLEKQYYKPVCVGGVVVQQRDNLVCEGGSWDWAVNTDGNPQGVGYADQVRALIRQ